MTESQPPLFSQVSVNGLSFEPGARPLVMAVINASPESFYEGSVARGGDGVRRAAEEATRAGADVLDIGAMSTAPYKHTRISEQEETDRMSEAVDAAQSVSGLPISADTQRAAVAQAALEAGATWINDVSALTGDEAMAEVAAQSRAGLILMAAEPQLAGRPVEDPVEAVAMLLREALGRARVAGIPEERVVLDPGVGFFRNAGREWQDFDLALLRGLPRLHALGLPLLVGASRKSFIGKLLDRPEAADRLAGSLAAACWCAAQGVAIVRTHDVAETRDALRFWKMIEDAGQAAS